MSIALIILSILFFACSVALVFVREMLAPVTSFLGLLFMWLSDALPLNSTIVIMWLCMSVVVSCVPLLQSAAARAGKAGLGYMTAGAFTGMAVGLMGVSFAETPGMLYGIMIVATAAGTFFGFLLYTNTPGGRGYSISSGRFFSHLLAKGFPLAITVMQIGVVLVLLVWTRSLAAAAV